MSRRRIVIAVIVLVVVVGIVAGIAIGGKGRGVLIKTATVTQENLSVTVSASGQVAAGVKGDVYPAAQSILKAVYVRDGQTVKAGQKIALLDEGPLELQVKQAQAGIAQARAGIAGADAQLPSGADRSAARAAETAAWRAYSLAREQYVSLKNVYAVSPPAVRASMAATLAAAGVQKDQAYSGYKAAKAARVRLGRTGAAHASASASYAAKSQSQAALDLAEDSLNNVVMTAPMDGVVIFNAVGAPGPDGSTPKAAVGAAVSPASAPFSVIQLDQAEFIADVDETDIGKVKEGMKSVVTLDAFPGESFNTKVSRIKPISTTTSSGGTAFEVAMSLADSGKRLGIGMQGNADIGVSGVAGALTVPIEALFDQGGKSYVYIVSGGRLTQQQVQVGTQTDTQAQIKSGAKAGDVVALSGATAFTNGMAVRTK